MKKKPLLLMVVLLASVVTACGGSTTPSGVTASPTPTLPSPPVAGTISATISGLGSLSGGPFVAYGMAADNSVVWIHNGDTGTLVRIDPQTNTVVATISIASGPGEVAIAQGAVWVANATAGTLSRIDSQTNRVVATITLPAKNGRDGVAVAVSPGAVWVNDTVDDALIRIDPQTNRVVATIPNQFGPSDISFGAGATWVSTFTDPTHGLTRIDPQTNQVQARLDVGSTAGLQCTAVVALAQTVWAVALIPGNGPSVVLKRIDPDTNTVRATISVPGVVPFHFAADERGVWVWAPEGLLRIDPQTNRVVGELAMTGGAGVALGDGSVWFANASNGTLLRITPAP